MTRRLIVRPLAESDVYDAATWYESRQAGLGLRFLDAVDHVFKRMHTAPLQFPSISSAVRRALLQTFPFAVYFHVTDEAVVILAVLHLHRDPRVWRTRS